MKSTDRMAYLLDRAMTKDSELKAKLVGREIETYLVSSSFKTRVDEMV